jgi:NAD(P)-dependent dehydrogenase (short-subunit alcohol dehydrogenase family)
LSGEVGRRGVNVNAVLPGYTLTPQTSERTEELRRTTGLSTAAVIERMVGRDQALGRPGTAHEVAEAIAFLASDAADLITGVALPVDGGTLHGVW